MRFNIKKKRKGKSYTFLGMYFWSPSTSKLRNFSLTIFRVDILASFNCWILTTEKTKWIYGQYEDTESLKNCWIFSKVKENVSSLLLYMIFSDPIFTDPQTFGSTCNYSTHFKNSLGTFPVVQWLRLCTPNAGGPGSIPGQGIRSHMLQLKIPHTVTKIKDPECCN